MNDVEHPLAEQFQQAKKLCGKTVWWRPLPGLPQIAVGKVSDVLGLDITEDGEQLVRVTRGKVTALARASQLHIVDGSNSTAKGPRR